MMVSIKEVLSSFVKKMKSGPNWSAESKMIQSKDFEAIEVMKERKCEISLGVCMSDQSLI